MDLDKSFTTVNGSFIHEMSREVTSFFFLLDISRVMKIKQIILISVVDITFYSTNTVHWNVNDIQGSFSIFEWTLIFGHKYFSVSQYAMINILLHNMRWKNQFTIITQSDLIQFFLYIICRVYEERFNDF